MISISNAPHIRPAAHKITFGLKNGVNRALAEILIQTECVKTIIQYAKMTENKRNFFFFLLLRTQINIEELFYKLHYCELRQKKVF